MIGVVWTGAKTKFMYALCPQCDTSQTITPKQLKKKQGRVICKVCGHRFDALPSLSDKPHEPKLDKSEPDEPKEIFSWQKPTQVHTKRWGLASLFGLLLLLYQVHYFVGYPLAQNPHIRPWLNPLYELPIYHNMAEYTVVGSSLERMENKHYYLQISLINQADYSQTAPRILVRLQNRYGMDFAQRVFNPDEYQEQQKTIAANDSVEVELFIANPETPIAGYQIALY